MGFVSEEIREQHREYFDSIGFTYLVDRKPLEPSWWAIDREREIILVSRGGVPCEIFMGYELYLSGELIEIEAVEKTEGDWLDRDLKVSWLINKIEIPKELFEKGYDVENVKNIIRVAFEGYGTRGIERSKILAVEVEINVEPKQKNEQNVEKCGFSDD